MPQNNIPGSPKQIEFWKNCTHRWNIKAGATRSGKTYMDYFLIPRRLLAVKGLDGLNVMLGNTRETLRRNIIIPMQNIYGTRRISSIHSDNSCVMFGEQVFMLGADNAAHVDRIRGASIKYCYGDEVATWNKETFDMLKSRMDKEYSVFDGTCNPDSPSHWLKVFLDSDADIFQQHYTIFDNPFLPKVVVDNLCKEYAGTIYYDRYILGLWALAEGLIYQNYKEAIAEPPAGISPSDICVSIDYGTMNPFAALLWKKYGNVWYAVREYYWNGRERQQKTDQEYGDEIDAWLAPEIGERGSAKIMVIVDPSAASFIALLKKKAWAKVIPADNDVLDGIRETATAIQTGAIKVSPALTNWRKEAESYVWDEKSGIDKPLKVNDHLMDANRYFVKTKRIVKKQNQASYTPIIGNYFI